MSAARRAAAATLDHLPAIVVHRAASRVAALLTASYCWTDVCKHMCCAMWFKSVIAWCLEFQEVRGAAVHASTRTCIGCIRLDTWTCSRHACAQCARVNMHRQMLPYTCRHSSVSCTVHVRPYKALICYCKSTWFKSIRFTAAYTMGLGRQLAAC
jgi:hypothetical protein